MFAKKAKSILKYDELKTVAYEKCMRSMNGDASKVLLGRIGKGYPLPQGGEGGGVADNFILITPRDDIYCILKHSPLLMYWDIPVLGQIHIHSLKRSSDAQ